MVPKVLNDVSNTRALLKDQNKVRPYRTANRIVTQWNGISSAFEWKTTHSRRAAAESVPQGLDLGYQLFEVARA